MIHLSDSEHLGAEVAAQWYCPYASRFFLIDNLMLRVTLQSNTKMLQKRRTIYQLVIVLIVE